MGNTLKQPKSTIYILIALIILGIGIRCLNIDNIYSHDEVYTSFRINGHISGRVEKNIEGKALFSEQIKEFQSHDGTTWKEAFNAFSTRPEHPPFFLLLSEYGQMYLVIQ